MHLIVLTCIELVLHGLHCMIFIDLHGVAYVALLLHAWSRTDSYGLVWACMECAYGRLMLRAWSRTDLYGLMLACMDLR